MGMISQGLNLWASREIATTLDTLDRHRGLDGEILNIKIWEPTTSMKFLGVQSHGPHQDIPSEGKDKLLHVVPLSIGKSRTPCVVRVLGRQYSHLGLLL